MSRDSYAVQQARLERQIAVLKNRAEWLENQRRRPVIASIIKSMHAFNISPAEIAKAFNSQAYRRQLSRRPAKQAVEPKYRHPATGDSWTGRGRPPRWLSLAEANGISRDSFLIRSAMNGACAADVQVIPSASADA